MTDWRSIPGYPGYHASDDGQIRGKRGSVLKPEINPRNHYQYCSLQVNGKQVLKSVHGLIALAFHGPCPKGLEVRHLNGIKLDCRASNLEYGTRSQNMQDAVKHGMHVNTRKTHCKNGHEFDYITPTTGARQCLTCKQDRKDARR